MPAMAVESGPAAGVIAAALVGRRRGLPNIISFDMGGTTAKASLIEGGEINDHREYEVGGGGNVRRWLHGTGHPIRVPVIDLAEVSAGGGRIAWIDPGGVLRVGPESAGAEPGPVCYGQGGERPRSPTRISCWAISTRSRCWAVRCRCDLERARAAIETQIARPLSLGVLEAAAGIVEVVNAGMAGALRIVSVERGHDPREFTLVAFGGAGPVHAARLAEELDIPRVLIPPIPGGFSALGLVATTCAATTCRRSTRADAAPPRNRRRVRDHGRRGPRMLRGAGVPKERWEVTRTADCRYGRQAYELTVPLAPGLVTRAALDRLAQAFTSAIARPTVTRAPTRPSSWSTSACRRWAARRRLELTRAQARGGAVRRVRRRGPRYFKETGLVPLTSSRARPAAGRRPVGARDRRGRGHHGRRAARLEAAVDAGGLIVPEERAHAR